MRRHLKLSALTALATLGGCQSLGFDVTNSVSNAAQKVGGDYRACTTSSTTPEMSGEEALKAERERAAHCHDFYRSVSVGNLAFDLGGSLVSGAGAVGMLFNGGAGANTVGGFGFAALTPVVLGDVVNQPEQAALARQARDAVDLAVCHSRLVSEELDALATPTVEPAGQAVSLVNHRDTVDGLILARYKELLLARTTSDPNAAAAPEPSVADFVTQDKRLEELVRLSDAIQATIEAQAGVTRAREAVANESDARIAQRLRLRLNTINETWLGHFLTLTPSSDQSLRTILAAPFTASAKLIAGGQPSAAPETQNAVEQARYNFTSSRMTFGVPAAPAVEVSAPAPVKLMLFKQEQWSTLRAIQEGLTAARLEIVAQREQLAAVAQLDRRVSRGACMLDDGGTP